MHNGGAEGSDGMNNTRRVWRPINEKGGKVGQSTSLSTGVAQFGVPIYQCLGFSIVFTKIFDVENGGTVPNDTLNIQAHIHLL